MRQVGVVAKKQQKRSPASGRWCELVAIGASAGGLPALSALIGSLDSEFPPIIVVQHLDPNHKSQSVAAIYGEHAIGVILSGSNRDGSDGIAAIRSAGGITVAQDPMTAEYRVMPQAAIDTGCIDLIVPIDKIGSVLSRLFMEGRTGKWPEM